MTLRLLLLNHTDPTRFPKKPVERDLDDDVAVPSELSEVRDDGPHVWLLRLREFQRDLPLETQGRIYLRKSPVYRPYLRGEQALYRRIESIVRALGEVFYSLHGPRLDSYPCLPRADGLLRQFKDCPSDFFDCLRR